MGLICWWKGHIERAIGGNSRYTKQCERCRKCWDETLKSWRPIGEVIREVNRAMGKGL